MSDTNIKETYNNISESFNHTRYNIWRCVKEFLDNIESKSLIGDIGCGNGKNMVYRKDCYNYGCDLSDNLVKICLKKDLNVVLGNILNIPYNNDIFNYVLCVAVIHHLDSIIKRKRAIDELIRITKPGGNIFILVWAFEQEYSSKKKFNKQENLIDWKDNKGNILGKRYYYVFKKNELESLIPKNVKIIKSFYEKGNWGVILNKK